MDSCIAVVLDLHNNCMRYTGNNINNNVYVLDEDAGCTQSFYENIYLQ